MYCPLERQTLIHYWMYILQDSIIYRSNLSGIPDLKYIAEMWKDGDIYKNEANSPFGHHARYHRFCCWLFLVAQQLYQTI